MRLARGLLLSTLLVSGAQAADYLRGPISEPPAYQAQPTAAPTGNFDWSGFYVGATASYNTGRISNNNFGDGLATRAFPNLTVTDQIGKLFHTETKSFSAPGYGVFFGYNVMWDDVVLGVEGEYNRTNISTNSAVMPIGRRLIPPGSTTLAYETRITGGGVKTTVPDYGVVRLRAGAAYGQFLPYASIGVVLANARTTASLQGTTTEYILNASTNNWDQGGTVNANVTRKNQTLSWGYALGGGLDVALTSNIFLRGKYEFLSFGGNKVANVNLHTFKGGIGAKF